MLGIKPVHSCLKPMLFYIIIFPIAIVFGLFRSHQVFYHVMNAQYCRGYELIALFSFSFFCFFRMEWSLFLLVLCILSSWQWAVKGSSISGSGVNLNLTEMPRYVFIFQKSASVSLNKRWVVLVSLEHDQGLDKAVQIWRGSWLCRLLVRSEKPLPTFLS